MEQNERRAPAVLARVDRAASEKPVDAASSPAAPVP